jgi:hypothetical protein
MSDDDLSSALGKLARDQAEAPELDVSAAADAELRARVLGRLLRGKQLDATRRRRLWWSAGIASLAAAVALFLFRPRPPAVLPEYESAFDGGQRAERAAADATNQDENEAIVLGSDAHFSFTFRPRANVTGPVAARALVQRGDETRLLRLVPEVSANGAVRLAGSGQQVFDDLPRGAWTLLLVAGRPSQITSDAAALAQLARDPGAGVRSARRKIILAAQ